MFSRQVDDVPPKAEAVTVDAKLNVSTQTKRQNSPELVETIREGRNARLLSIKTLSQEVDRRLQTRETINHRRRNRRSRSRRNRRMRPRPRGMPARIGERRLAAGERRSRERERRRRDPGLEDRRPRVREGERERIFFGIFQKKKAKQKYFEKTKNQKALVESRDNTCERENKK